MLSVYEYAIKCFVLVMCKMMTEVAPHFDETSYIQIHQVPLSLKSGSEICFSIFVQ